MKSYKDYKDALAVVKKSAASPEANKIEVLIIDSFTSLAEFVMLDAKATRIGFDIFSYYNDEIYRIIDDSKELPFMTVFLGIDDIESDSKGTQTRFLKVEGKKLKGFIEKEFTIVLHTVAVVGDNGKVEYKFLTNTDTVRAAKSPMEMFEEQYIPNDLNMVIKRVNEFYNEPEKEING